MDKFQQRLIHLSVDIEDKTKIIDLLIKSINEYNESTLKQIESDNAKYRLQLNQRSKENNQILAMLLEKYEVTTRKKKDVSVEVELLSTKMKAENNATKSRLLKVRQIIMENISDAAEEWNSCKEEREELWTTKKIEHVRACTVNALQPEIKRLSDSHESELCKLTEEVNVRKQYLEREISLNFQREYNKYWDDRDQKKAFVIESRIKQWNAKIKEEEEEHRQQIEELKLDQVNHEEEKLENVSPAEINSLTKNIIEEADKQLKDIKIMKEEKRDIIRKELQSFQKDKEKEFINANNNWFNGQRVKMQQSFEEQMSSIEENILHSRDRDIEDLIRHYNRLENEIETQFDQEKNDGMLCESTNHLSDKIQYMIKQNREKEDMIENTARCVERLKNSKQSLFDHVQTKDRCMTRISSEIGENELQKNDAETKMINSKTRKQLKDLENHHVKIQNQKHSLIIELEQVQRKHQNEIRTMNEHHAMKLKEMESEFLLVMIEKDKLMDFTSNEIHEIKVMLDKKREILLSIFTSVKQKRRNSKAMKTRKK